MDTLRYSIDRVNTKGVLIILILIPFCWGDMQARQLERVLYPGVALPQFRARDEWVLGKDETQSIEHFLVAPTLIALAPGGGVYVADLATMNIKEFSGSGRYVRTIGSRGQGPEEFDRIGAMYVDRESEQLFVVDVMTRQLKTVDIGAGRIVESVRMPTSRTTPIGTVLPGGRHVLAYVDRAEVDATNAPLVHLLSEDRRTATASSLAMGNFVDESDTIGLAAQRGWVGSLISLRDGRVVFAPFYYAGELLLLAPERGLSIVGRVEGAVRKGNAYEVVEGPAADTGGADYRTMAGGGATPVSIRFPCQSRGLFERESGWGHLILCDIYGSRQFAIELFSESGELRAFGIVHDLEASLVSNIAIDGEDPLGVVVFGHRMENGATLVFKSRIVEDSDAVSDR